MDFFPGVLTGRQGDLYKFTAFAGRQRQQAASRHIRESRRSSVAEQLIRNQQVGGSTPLAGSKPSLLDPEAM